MGGCCASKDIKEQYAFQGHQQNPVAKRPSGVFRPKDPMGQPAVVAAQQDQRQKEPQTVAQPQQPQQQKPRQPTITSNPTAVSEDAGDEDAFDEASVPRQRLSTRTARPAVRSDSIIGTLALYISPLDVEVCKEKKKKKKKRKKERNPKSERASRQLSMQT
jgi:hypothetical protein